MKRIIILGCLFLCGCEQHVIIRDDRLSRDEVAMALQQRDQQILQLVTRIAELETRINAGKK